MSERYIDRVLEKDRGIYREWYQYLQAGQNQPAMYGPNIAGQESKLPDQSFNTNSLLSNQENEVIEAARLRVCEFDVSSNREGVRYQTRKTDLEWG